MRPKLRPQRKPGNGGAASPSTGLRVSRSASENLPPCPREHGSETFSSCFLRRLTRFHISFGCRSREPDTGGNSAGAPRRGHAHEGAAQPGFSPQVAERRGPIPAREGREEGGCWRLAVTLLGSWQQRLRLQRQKGARAGEEALEGLGYTAAPLFLLFSGWRATNFCCPGFIPAREEVSEWVCVVCMCVCTVSVCEHVSVGERVCMCRLVRL